MYSDGGLVSAADIKVFFNLRESTTMTKQMQKGFTLIELMVVIVIIGILAAIAIPSYLDNANRAKITEGVNLVAPLKAALSEAYIGLGEFPSGNHGAAAGALGINSDKTAYATDLVQEIEYAQQGVNTATLTITYDDSKLGAGVTNSTNTLVFTATGAATGVTWSCRGGGSTLADTYKPANCRGTT